MSDVRRDGGRPVGPAVPVVGLVILAGLGVAWPLLDGADPLRVALVAGVAAVLGALIATVGLRYAPIAYLVLMLGGSIALEYLGFEGRAYTVSWVASMLGGLAVGLALGSRRRGSSVAPRASDGDGSRTQRRAREELGLLVTGIEREQGVSPGARESGADDESLATAAERARLALRSLTEGTDAGAAQLMVELGESTVRGWHPDATLTARAQQVARSGRELLRQRGAAR